MLREPRKKKTKELIVRTAIQLFKEKGYENVTVEEITQLCGIAKGTFFNYFPKKEHMLLYVGSSYNDLLNEIVRKHREGPLKDRLMELFHDFLRLYLKHAELLRLVLIESIQSTSGSTDDTSNLTLFQQSIRQLLEEAKDNGSLRSRHDASDCAIVLVSLFYQTLLSASADADEHKLTADLQKKFDVIWDGIADA
ncbi:TetR family transcriptional regulator [Paenibacillus cellulosilyticus]|uniref:TetR family transcriptional regulator n=1 Tax=Paenibacillus cellulosilyticus TaxID=375489 RepID=A0A2V2Z7B5_9BACL|nr:TetR/AcrR family transcriptional regulator [Paenibacillus cellulosilyticus]PWW07256.1 TetR family transcriptional regulator [Paenibacillus cellulosilyticus]QKS44554.1 TetR/AcrR family transcriptional regulator [Paenibacillus cellulosilyticus]